MLWYTTNLCLLGLPFAMAAFIRSNLSSISTITTSVSFRSRQGEHEKVSNEAIHIDDLESHEVSIHDNRISRLEAIQDALSSISSIDYKELHDAVQQSLLTPSSGYNASFGPSAIKAYKTYLYPKSRKNVKHREDLSIEDEDTKNKSKVTFPLTIVLDNLRSAFNVGSIFRTADACGCKEVITTGITPHPFGAGAGKLSKTALGADFVVPSRHFTKTISAIEALRKENAGEIYIVGLETTEKSQCYTSVSYPRNGGGTVVVLGNEVTGVDVDILPLLDGVIEIPMFGTKNSLNVSACAPVVMYEILRKWGAMTE